MCMPRFILCSGGKHLCLLRVSRVVFLCGTLVVDARCPVRGCGVAFLPRDYFLGQLSLFETKKRTNAANKIASDGGGDLPP